LAQFAGTPSLSSLFARFRSFRKHSRLQHSRGRTTEPTLLPRHCDSCFLAWERIVRSTNGANSSCSHRCMAVIPCAQHAVDQRSSFYSPAPCARFRNDVAAAENTFVAKSTLDFNHFQHCHCHVLVDTWEHVERHTDRTRNNSQPSRDPDVARTQVIVSQCIIISRSLLYWAGCTFATPKREVFRYQGSRSGDRYRF